MSEDSGHEWRKVQRLLLYLHLHLHLHLVLHLHPAWTFQIYESEAHHTQVCKNVHKHLPVMEEEVPKYYVLDSHFRFGPVERKDYENGEVMFFFWLKNPHSLTKVLKIGSPDEALVDMMHDKVCWWPARSLQREK